MIYFFNTDVVFKEVPSEISLAFYIAGCPNGCKNCHWEDINKNDPYKYKKLTIENISNEIEKYKGEISCLLFLGGEWDIEYLLNIFKEIKKNHKIKICLYSGKDIDYFKEIDTTEIDYLKIGKYDEKFGGIESKNTNQRFVDLKNNKDITHLFWEN